MDTPLSRRQALRIIGGAAALSSSSPLWALEPIDRPHYTVSVVPQFQAAELHRDWTPVLERLSATTGVMLSLRLAPNIPRFETEVMAGGPDFVFMNPYHVVMAARAQGYKPLVRDTKPLTGILVVQKEHPIRSLKELDGQEIAFPSPNSFGASLWMRALLAEHEQIRIKPVYLQTHSNVYRQVIRGNAIAGGGVNNTLQQEYDEVRACLRVLFETPGTAPHPLCAHPRVPALLQQKMVEALIALANDSPGQVLLKEVAMPRPTPADYARDYKPLERFKLDKYVVLEQKG